MVGWRRTRHVAGRGGAVVGLAAALEACRVERGDSSSWAHAEASCRGQGTPPSGCGGALGCVGAARAFRWCREADEALTHTRPPAWRPCATEAGAPCCIRSSTGTYGDRARLGRLARRAGLGARAATAHTPSLARKILPLGTTVQLGPRPTRGARPCGGDANTTASGRGGGGRGTRGEIGGDRTSSGEAASRYESVRSTPPAPPPPSAPPAAAFSGAKARLMTATCGSSIQRGRSTPSGEARRRPRRDYRLSFISENGLLSAIHSNNIVPNSNIAVLFRIMVHTYES